MKKLLLSVILFGVASIADAADCFCDFQDVAILESTGELVEVEVIIKYECDAAGNPTNVGASTAWVYGLDRPYVGWGDPGACN